MSIATTLHLFSIVVGIGGTVFALWVLRPVALQLLEPPQRLSLWQRRYQRFFSWVCIAIIILPATSYWVIFAIYGGMANVGLNVHFMSGAGVFVVLLFLQLYFAPHKHLTR